MFGTLMYIDSLTANSPFNVSALVSALSPSHQHLPKPTHPNPNPS